MIMSFVICFYDIISYDTCLVSIVFLPKVKEEKDENKIKKFK